MRTLKKINTNFPPLSLSPFTVGGLNRDIKLASAYWGSCDNPGNPNSLNNPCNPGSLHSPSTQISNICHSTLGSPNSSQQYK